MLKHLDWSDQEFQDMVKSLTGPVNIHIMSCLYVNDLSQYANIYLCDNHAIWVTRYHRNMTVITSTYMCISHLHQQEISVSYNTYNYNYNYIIVLN